MTSESQYQKLHDFIRIIPGEPSHYEGTGDTAIRLIIKYRGALIEIVRILDAYADSPDGMAMGEIYLLAKRALGSGYESDD